MPNIPEFNPNQADPVDSLNTEPTTENSEVENSSSQQTEENSDSTSELVSQVKDLRNAVNDWRAPAPSNPVTTTGAEELSVKGAETLTDAASSSGVGASSVGSAEAASVATASEASMVGSAGVAVAADTTLVGSAAMSTGAVVGTVGAETAAVGASASAVVGIAGAEVVGTAGLGVAAAEAATGVGIPLAVITAALTLAPTAFKWIKEHYLIVVVLILLSNMPFILLALAVASSFKKFGNPQGGIAVPNSAVIPGTSCKEMTPQLVTTYNGKGITLTLGGTSGKFSKEEPLDASKLALGLADAKLPGYTSDWMKYYITARWPYTAINFGSAAAGVKYNNSLFKDTSPPQLAYAGRRVIIYNPTTGLAVLGVATEYGPQPWTGYDPEHPNPANEYEQQLGLWNGPGSRGSSVTGNYRVNDPVGYIERVAGGPSAVQSAIKATNETPILFGFATNDLQNHAPGPITCTPVTVSDTVAVSPSGTGYTVCIDAGHGGSNGGAVGKYTGIDETHVNWEVATALQAKLKAAGYKVVMTKTSENQSVGNPERAHLCNDAKANLAIHIHANAGNGPTDTKGNGYQIYKPDQQIGLMNKDNIAASGNAASAFHNAFSQSIGSGLKNDRPGEYLDSRTQHGTLVTANESIIPTFLVEMFFVNNANDAAWYRNNGTSKMADAFLAGIAAAKKTQSKK